MKESIESIAKDNKGMTLEACMERANAFIERNGACLLVMDIVGSGQHSDRTKLFDDYSRLLTDLNTEFEDSLPENNLTNLGRVEKGFNMVIGDGATGAINDAGIIPQVMNYAAGHPTAIPLRYAVAEDGFDKAGIRLIK